MSRLIWILLYLSVNAGAVTPDQKTLPIGLAPHEKAPLDRAPLSEPPEGHIRSIGEWETSDSIITLWPNKSMIKAMAARGPVTLLADGLTEKTWWMNWLQTAAISAANVKIMTIPTDSYWIRDYGPWYILDGLGRLGMVDTKYNRPRPLDDVVPGHLASALGVPIFQPGLVHTGGNYYADGHGNAFSSTLVYRENQPLNAEEVRRRMSSYLGIDRYTTSKLAPGITIEHLDTFGKLVAPDTWVFSEFPQGSPYRADSETMVALLRTLKSPYGTPYKIFRMKMTAASGTNYRAYINAFQSNGVLYYPTYDVPAADEAAKKVYQAALPGHEIVGVSDGGTYWGDSVHCRTNNLYTRKTIFIFPKITGTTIDAEIYASPEAEIVTADVHWFVNGRARGTVPLEPLEDRRYRAQLPSQPIGTKLSFYVSVADSAGLSKTEPARAPYMKIDAEVVQ